MEVNKNGVGKINRWRIIKIIWEIGINKAQKVVDKCGKVCSDVFMANVHVSLRLDEKLVAEVDADAKRLERSRNWVISRRLENSRTLPPLYRVDGDTGAVSIITEKGWKEAVGELPKGLIAGKGTRLRKAIQKKIAEVSASAQRGDVAPPACRDGVNGGSSEKFRGSGKCPHDYMNWMVCPKCSAQDGAK